MDSGLFVSADGRFGFRHALLREAVVAELPDARARELHEELAGVVDAYRAEVARHLRLAGLDDEAAHRLATAAQEAVAIGADRGGRRVPRGGDRSRARRWRPAIGAGRGLRLERPARGRRAAAPGVARTRRRPGRERPRARRGGEVVLRRAVLAAPHPDACARRDRAARRHG
jgi:hypothetical protein